MIKEYNLDLIEFLYKMACCEIRTSGKPEIIIEIQLKLLKDTFSEEILNEDTYNFFGELPLDLREKYFRDMLRASLKIIETLKNDSYFNELLESFIENVDDIEN
jgi:hypothetical protein